MSVSDVVFISSLTVDALSRRLYWIDSAKVVTHFTHHVHRPTRIRINRLNILH